MLNVWCIYIFVCNWIFLKDQYSILYLCWVEAFFFLVKLYRTEINSSSLCGRVFERVRCTRQITLSLRQPLYVRKLNGRTTCMTQLREKSQRSFSSKSRLIACIHLYECFFLAFSTFIPSFISYHLTLIY